MAAYFCPNFSNPEVKKDFNSLVNEFGENRAYLYWHRHKGDMSQIKEKASKIDKTPVSKIDKTYIERLDEANEKYGDLIGKDNNPFVWDIQDEFNLLEKEKFLPPLEGEKFKRRNFRKIGDEAAAERLAKRIEDKYGPDVT